MKKLVAVLASTAILMSLQAPEAMALAPFKKAFKKKYVDPSDNEALAAAFKTASCNTCHVKGKKKDVRNKYGDELAKLIEGDANARIKAAGKVGPAEKKAENEKVLAELVKAMDEVAKMSPAEGGPTYGDIIKSGALAEIPFEAEEE